MASGDPGESKSMGVEDMGLSLRNLLLSGLPDVRTMAEDEEEQEMIGAGKNGGEMEGMEEGRDDEMVMELDDDGNEKEMRRRGEVDVIG
ncbi:MAG: hypothetical protein Q9184_005641 [Pyrenodesmia sp. 2 TL-2023]